MITQENTYIDDEIIKCMAKTCEKYNDALERAKYALTTDMDNSGHWAVNYIFPELKEYNNNEKIRKSLISFLKSPFVHENITDEKVAPWIDWLEKQNANKEYVFRPVAGTTIESAVEQALKQSNVVLAFNGFYTQVKDKTFEEILTEYDRWIEKQCEQPTDKVAPKFKVGDWITTTDEEGNVTTEKIIEFCGDKVRLIDTNGFYTLWPKHELNYYHLWTLQDAKDGDVLHSTGFHNDCIFIFNGLDNWRFDEPNGDRAVATGHCCLSVSADKIEFGIQGPDCVEVNTIEPATKIQRDLLFQKMKEAGYEWDDENKKLSKQPLQIIPKFCIGQLITDNNGTWYKITNIKCLDDWYYELYNVCEDNTYSELCSIIDEKFRVNRFVSEIKNMMGD